MVAPDDRVIVQRLIKERQICIDNSVKAMRRNNRFQAQVLAGLGGYGFSKEGLVKDDALFGAGG